MIKAEIVAKTRIACIDIIYRNLCLRCASIAPRDCPLVPTVVLCYLIITSYRRTIDFQSQFGRIGTIAKNGLGQVHHLT